MKVLYCFLLMSLVYSCTMPNAGVNKFAKLYKGLERSEVMKFIDLKDKNFKTIKIEDKEYNFDVVYVTLIKYISKSDPHNASSMSNIIYKNYPFVILYQNNKIFFQGFVWEFKKNNSKEIRSFGNKLNEVLNGK